MTVNPDERTSVPERPDDVQQAEDALVEDTARRILERFRPAFEELAK